MPADTKATQPSASPVGRSSTDRSSGERRRSSGMFANLQQAKRNPENQAAASRRLSAAEHNQSSYLSSMWNKTFRG